MYSLIALGCVAFASSLFLTPLVRNVFRYWNLVDHPDSVRKHHQHAVPRVGGIAIALSFLASLCALALLSFVKSGSIQVPLPYFLPLIPSALLVFWIGLIDDVIGLRPWPKFAGQIIAATGAYIAGIHVQAFGGHTFANWLSFPLTLFWLVLCTNALNLIDGVDGLAAGVGLVATGTMLVAAVLQDNKFLALATIPLVGCLLGFLRYNFNPATIFLGDSGSLFIGFLLGCYGVLWSEKSATILGMTAPLIALSVPLMDTSLSVARRFLTGKPLFGADRGHIHHRLLDRGLTPRRVVLVFYGICGIAAVFSLIMSSQHFERLVIFAFCALAWVGIARLGYVEFRVAGRMFLDGAFRRHLGSQILLQQYESSLRVASTPQQCWKVIEGACRELGFQKVQLSFRGQTFEYEADGKMENCWRMHVPLSEVDSIDLSRSFDESVHVNAIAPFADLLRRAISENISAPAQSENVASVQQERKERYRVVARNS